MRATEQEWHPNAAALASVQQKGEGEEVQSNKRLCHDERTAAAGAGSEESKVAEDDDDSEPSDNDDDG